MSCPPLATRCLSPHISSFAEKEDEKESAEEMRKFKKSRTRARKAQAASVGAEPVGSLGCKATSSSMVATSPCWIAGK